MRPRDATDDGNGGFAGGNIFGLGLGAGFSVAPAPAVGEEQLDGDERPDLDDSLVITPGPGADSPPLLTVGKTAASYQKKYQPTKPITSPMVRAFSSIKPISRE